jgi:hypothetical protein
MVLAEELLNCLGRNDNSVGIGVVHILQLENVCSQTQLCLGTCGSCKKTSWYLVA